MRRRSNRQYVDLSYFRETADALLFDVETNSREFTNEINTVKEEKAKWDEVSFHTKFNSPAYLGPRPDLCLLQKWAWHVSK